MELKRDLVKYVRDKAKSKYDKGTECFICGSYRESRLSSFSRSNRVTRNLVEKEQDYNN